MNTIPFRFGKDIQGPQVTVQGAKMLSFLSLDWWIPGIAASLLFVWCRIRYKYNQQCFLKLESATGQDSPSPSVETVRILSQNMWCTNSWGAEKKGSKGPEVRKRFDELVRAAVDGNYDVLLLQEMFAYRLAYFFLTIEDVVYLTEQLEAAGFLYHTGLVYNLPVMIGQSAGVAIFSKHPIREWTGSTFAKYSLKDSLNAKGFVHAEVVVGKESVHFFSTHLDSSHQQPAVKHEQVNELVAAVAKRATSSHAAIVAGDFNICSHSSFSKGLYSHLVNAMATIGMETVFTGLPYTHRKGETLDHVFVGGGNVTVESITAKGQVHLECPDVDLPVSDHDGLSMTVRLASA